MLTNGAKNDILYTPTGDIKSFRPYVQGNGNGLNRGCVLGGSLSHNLQLRLAQQVFFCCQKCRKSRL